MNSTEESFAGLYYGQQVEAIGRGGIWQSAAAWLLPTSALGRMYLSPRTWAACLGQPCIPAVRSFLLLSVSLVLGQGTGTGCWDKIFILTDFPYSET